MTKGRKCILCIFCTNITVLSHSPSYLFQGWLICFRFNSTCHESIVFFFFLSKVWETQSSLQCIRWVGPLKKNPYRGKRKGKPRYFPKTTMLLTEFSQEFRSSLSCFQFSEIYKPLDSTWCRVWNQTWRREPRVCRMCLLLKGFCWTNSQSISSYH